MKSSNLFQYTRSFFDSLEMYEDLYRGHNYKNYLVSSIERFQEDETGEHAFDVFRAFFDVYRITVPGNKESFFDLIDVLHQFEEHAAVLIDKQRDHLIHSVNVFLTGIAIYGNNDRFKAAFDSAVPEREYKHAYTTKNEEFLYRWGLASLLHDIGYPIEIAFNQINRFLRQTQLKEENFKVRARLYLNDFEKYNQILHLSPEEEFICSYREAYPELSILDPYKPTDLMAGYISLHHNVDLNILASVLEAQIEKMADSGFVDHGYFSSLILLRWYGALIQKNDYTPDYFFWPVLDAASAILLHNYYKNGLQREPFLVGPMAPESHPIAYLLILSDELQEWNREARGVLTRNSVLAESIQFSGFGDSLLVDFVTRDGYLPEEFCNKKKDLLFKLLNIQTIFPKEVALGNSSIGELKKLRTNIEGNTPRPILENLEKLAIAIHSEYNDTQLRLFPNQPLKYPTFSDLPRDLQYSNLRQAMSIFNKISLVGYRVSPVPSTTTFEFTPEEIEFLARKEHEEWLEERSSKQSDQIVPYDSLPESAKEQCRSSVRAIPILLKRIGYSIERN